MRFLREGFLGCWIEVEIPLSISPSHPSEGRIAIFTDAGRDAARNPVAPKKKKRLREQRDATCPVLTVKIFLFSATPNHRHIYGRLVLSRGAARDRHGRWERDAVDADGALDEAH